MRPRFVLCLLLLTASVAASPVDRIHFSVTTESPIDGARVIGSASLASLTAGRISGANGTAQTADKISVSGWGTGATATFRSGSNDTRGQVIVTTGIGALSSNPTCAVAFKDGAYASVPTIMVVFDSASTGPASNPGIGYCSATSTVGGFTLTFAGTPTGPGKSYRFNYIVVG